jgi:hypothetical protein
MCTRIAFWIFSPAPVCISPRHMFCLSAGLIILVSIDGFPSQAQAAQHPLLTNLGKTVFCPDDKTMPKCPLPGGLRVREN